MMGSSAARACTVSAPRLSKPRMQLPRISRASETGVIASPIDDTASARTGSPGICATVSRIASLMRPHTSRLSSSAQPGWGRTTLYSRLDRARIAPSADNAITLQPVVPTSIPNKLMKRNLPITLRPQLGVAQQLHDLHHDVGGGLDRVVQVLARLRRLELAARDRI